MSVLIITTQPQSERILALCKRFEGSGQRVDIMSDISRPFATSAGFREVLKHYDGVVVDGEVAKKLNGALPRELPTVSKMNTDPNGLFGKFQKAAEPQPQEPESIALYHKLNTLIVHLKDRNKCMLNGKNITLSSQDHAALCTLASAANQLVSEDELSAVTRFKPGRNTEQHIRRLKDKIKPFDIERIRGRGYALRADNFAPEVVMERDGITIYTDDTVTYKKKNLEVTPYTLKVLKIFMEHPPNIVITKELIFRTLYGEEHETKNERDRNNLVSKLARDLAEGSKDRAHPHGLRFFVAITNEGYMWTKPVPIRNRAQPAHDAPSAE